MRGASRSSSKRGAGCGGRYDVGPECCGLRTKVGDPRSDRRLTPTQRADGPSAYPCDSSAGGLPGGVGASDNSRSVMQQAAKSIRVRNAGEDLLPRPGSAQRSSALGWATARVPRKRHTGCPHPKHVGAAGAVKRPVVPHAPTGEKAAGDFARMGQAPSALRPASPGAGRHTGR